MSSHFHPDVTVSRDERIGTGPILVDGCPRCEEIAADPIVYLDSPGVDALWEQMLTVEERLGRTRPPGLPVSDLDRRARRDVWRIFLFLERHPHLAREKLDSDDARRAANIIP